MKVLQVFKVHVIYLDCRSDALKKWFMLVWFLTKLALGGRIVHCTSLKNKVEIYLHNLKKLNIKA